MRELHLNTVDISLTLLSGITFDSNYAFADSDENVKSYVVSVYSIMSFSSVTAKNRPGLHGWFRVRCRREGRR